MPQSDLGLVCIHGEEPGSTEATGLLKGQTPPYPAHPSSNEDTATEDI